jgi:DNA-binding NarL/FixJ family response regulator
MKSLDLTPLNSPKTEAFTGVAETGPFRVVIVDDDQNDRRMMRQDLEKTREFVCVGAYGSAKEALAEIPKVRPHVVLMDIRMPAMDGHECTRRLKAVSPRLKIIIVTGLLDINTMNKSMQAGADGYLIKPIAEAQYLAMLKFIVRNGRPFTEKSAHIAMRTF